jgi:type IV pilus assembly protein PilB
MEMRKTATKELLGQILVRMGVVTQEQVDRALSEQRRTGEKIGEILVRLGYASKEDVMKALALQMGVEYVRLEGQDFEEELIDKVPRRLAAQFKLIPIRKENGRVKVAMADPMDIYAIESLKMVLGPSTVIEPVLASEEEILRAIAETYASAERTAKEIEVEEVVEVTPSSEEEGDLSDETRALELAQQAPIIHLINRLIIEAVRERATDIHIESFENGVRVRYRIDGVLHDIQELPKGIQAAVISRVKIMAKMNIAERRLPQDGRILVRMPGHDLDLRVSTVPTIHGESVVMRILDRSVALLGLEALGLLPDDYARFEALIQRPYGIILATGPTGCGKTTTLNACIMKINSPERKIITIEEPVEYHIPGVNQIDVKAKIGLTFATALRHILRQDPDVIMVGEIRDYDTAENAIRAALTGHLVFSTVHTNDAAGAITRLIDLGVEPYLVASSLEGILAQRLVRVICPKCKEPYRPNMERLEEMGFDLKDVDGELILYRGRGCPECRGTGYKGRTGIFELLVMNPEIRKMTIAKASSAEIKEVARKYGMRTLREDGWKKILLGITTPEEVFRVSHVEEE